ASTSGLKVGPHRSKDATAVLSLAKRVRVEWSALVSVEERLRDVNDPALVRAIAVQAEGVCNAGHEDPMPRIRLFADQGVERPDDSSLCPRRLGRRNREDAADAARPIV